MSVAEAMEMASTENVTTAGVMTGATTGAMSADTTTTVGVATTVTASAANRSVETKQPVSDSVVAGHGAEADLGYAKNRQRLRVALLNRGLKQQLRAGGRGEPCVVGQLLFQLARRPS